MQNVFFIKDSIENKISYYHLLFFLLALPFDRFYSTIILVSFLVHSLIFFNKKKLQVLNKNILIMQSVFIVTLGASFYAIFMKAGFDEVSKQLAILLFPILLSTTSLNLSKYANALLLGFSVGCTITITYLFGDAIHVILYNKLPLSDLFSPAFVNHNFSLPIDMHATYLSMMLVVAFAFLLKQLLSRKLSFNAIVLYIICCAILLGGLLQLGSKSALICLFIIMNIVFPFFELVGKKRIKFILASLTLTTAFILIITSVDVFENRYVKTLKYDIEHNQNVAEEYGRADRWNVAMELVKRSPIIGTGSGSELPLLKDLYFEKKMYSAYLNSLNAHNQYLGFLINSGIVGLLIYLSTLCWGFVLAYKSKDVLLFSFLILIAIVSFTEDIFYVNKGIFFYAFFFPFLVLSKTVIPVAYKLKRRQPAAENFV